MASRGRRHGGEGTGDEVGKERKRLVPGDGGRPPGFLPPPTSLPHGPRPGTYERSVGISKTNELAVLFVTFKPLRLTGVAESIEDRDYHYTWVKRENEAMETSK